MNDEQLLLANAYLDDEVDDDERARAEGDAEVMAEVARLGALRDALRAVEAPDRSRRDRSVAAALTAFGDETSEADAAQGGRGADRLVPVPRPGRPRRAWWGVGAAAAALVVVAAAGVALRGGSDDDDTGGDSAALQEAPTQATEAAAAESRSAGDAAAATAAEGTGDGVESAPADTEANLDATPSTTTSAPVAPSAALLPVLGTPAELTGYVVTTPQDAALAPATCVQDGTFYGRVLYRSISAEVFATPTQIVALDATTCAVVERVGR